MQQPSASLARPAGYRAAWLACLLLAALIFSPASSAQEVIVNPDVPIERIDKSTLRAILSMRLRNWDNGEPIRVFVLDDQHPLHQRFTRQILGLYPHRLRSAWDRLVYAGLGQAPTQVGNELEMRTMVATTPGAIGYLEKDMIDDSVREITVE